MEKFGENDLEIFYNEPSIVIDNGRDRIEINFDEARMNLMNIIDKEVINKAIGVIINFEKEVKEKLREGTHLGSTELNHAISSLFWNIKPEAIGLETEAEVKLLGLAFKNACNKKEQEDELEILK